MCNLKFIEPHVFVAFFQIVTDVHLFQEKNAETRRKRDNGVNNHAGFSLLESMYSHRLLILQCAIFIVAHTVA